MIVASYHTCATILHAGVRGTGLRVLAIDTALGACAACVLDMQAASQPSIRLTADDASPVDSLHEGVLAQESLLIERGHAEALLPLIERVVARSAGGAAQQGFAALGRIAVTVGPGSFTGLRVGISAARAIGLAIGAPVVGVSTLAALLAPLVVTPDVRQPVLAAAIDARHGAIYFQATAPGGRIIVPARHLSIRDAARLLGTGAVTLTGPAAPLVAEELRASGLDVRVAETAPAPDIRWVARLGVAADPFTALPKPLYLRGADAKPQDKAHLPRQ